ncbi:hypothetical protein [Bombella saccharophila]|uniref:Uncharacterized protein n=1 Tax=Bombella saccharophila TaxID=2967338 RepID=A0ABT3W731_9PROT|nr:hypothetical protein [Bombella saccharophila]MCX5614877.1 hypothetical protein [Bombella saccharophila]
MFGGMFFWQRVRQSNLLGLLVAVVFVVGLCLLGLAGVALVDGFHLAGG